MCTENTKDPIRVVVADDHSCILSGVAHLVAAHTGMSLVGAATDARSLASLLDTIACDVVVSDLGMPGAHGESNAVSLLRRVVSEPPHRRVVILTMVQHGQMLAGLMRMGVAAIVDKRDVADSLTCAIEAAAHHQPFLSARARAIIELGQIAAPPRARSLSAREWEIFRLYTSGFTIPQIAGKLGRSAKTIGTQKRNAMRKLAIESDAELIEYAYRIGLM